jgi:hypothetical protein
MSSYPSEKAAVNKDQQLQQTQDTHPRQWASIKAMHQSAGVAYKVDNKHSYSIYFMYVLLFK